MFDISRLKGKLAFMRCHRRKPTREELDVWLGLRARDRLNSTRFIGVTGSAGKSTTTALLHHLLASRYRSAASLLQNTPRVLGRRIAEMSGRESFAVMEMSGHAPGILQQSCELVRPDMGIVISVSNDHYSNFRGAENTAREKSTLVRCTAPEGVVLLNAGDPAVAAMAGVARARVITFGRSANSDYVASDVVIDANGWLCFTCAHDFQEVSFRLPLPALHFLPSALAAIACANQCGIPLGTLAETVATFSPLPGRCSLHPLHDGRTLVCDTAKAPFSTLSLAFSVLEQFSASRPKRIVLGNVSDYAGAWGPKLRSVALQALTVADQLILHRPPTDISRLLSIHGTERVVAFNSIADIHAFLQSTARPDEVILLKSSSTNHLESLLLPLMGQSLCSRDPCALKVDCFNCALGFGRATQAVWRQHVDYSEGLVVLDGSASGAP